MTPKRRGIDVELQSTCRCIDVNMAASGRHHCWKYAEYNAEEQKTDVDVFCIDCICDKYISISMETQ